MTNKDFWDIFFDEFMSCPEEDVSEPMTKRYVVRNGKVIVDDFGFGCKPIRNAKRVEKIKKDKDLVIPPTMRSAKIKRVIVNEPAVIILWSDDTKTIAKTEGKEKFDAEKGFAIAVAKKFTGNRRFRDLLEEYIWESDVD